CDAPTHRQHGASRYLRWVCREYRGDADATKRFECLPGVDAGLTHLKQSLVKCSTLWLALSVESKGSAPALAVVRLGQIREFKVNSKCFCDVVGVGEVEFCNQSASFG